MDTNTKNSGNQSVLTELFEKKWKGWCFYSSQCIQPMNSIMCYHLWVKIYTCYNSQLARIGFRFRFKTV